MHFEPHLPDEVLGVPYFMLYKTCKYFILWLTDFLYCDNHFKVESSWGSNKFTCILPGSLPRSGSPTICDWVLSLGSNENVLDSVGVVIL